MGRTRLSIIVFAVALLSSFTGARADAPSTRPAQVVYVGLYVNDIYELDLMHSTYVADFYVWMRWRGDIDPGNFEFLNGTLDLKEHPISSESSGVKYLTYHCRGTFHTTFDYRRFPLDEHVLALQMEDASSQAGKLRYEIDRDDLQRVKAPELAGWTCERPEYGVNEHAYETNFGDPAESADASEVYSRLSCIIRIYRHSLSIFVKTFLGLFISVAIAFLSFVLKPGESDPRFGVGIAAIFGAVSSYIVVTNNLPEMPYLTLADKMHLFSFFMIFLSILQSCLTLRLVRHNKAKLAARIDHLALYSFPGAYAAVVVALTFA